MRATRVQKILVSLVVFFGLLLVFEGGLSLFLGRSFREFGGQDDLGSLRDRVIFFDEKDKEEPGPWATPLDPLVG